MAIYTTTYNPTSNTTPDPGFGGLAVTGNINTGHGSTTTSQLPAGTQTKSCLWTGFPAVSGQIASITLKFDWSEDGFVIVGGGSASNSFTVQYSLNGGGAFSEVFTHDDVTSPTSSNSQVSIPLPQDPTQIQVRDRMQATATADIGDSASITTTISNIRLEIVTADGGLLVMM